MCSTCAPTATRGDEDLHIDLNADLGESFGPYEIGQDQRVLELVSSANVACGFHGGDPSVMLETVLLASRAGTAVGAHPGFPDREGFGRRHMELSAAQVEADALYQIGALSAFCRAAGVEMRHVKAHGALHHAAVADRAIADALARAVKRYDPGLLFVALPGTHLEAAGRAAGLGVSREGFVDRGYLPDGRLVPRGRPGAFIENPKRAAERAVAMVRHGQVEAVDGSLVAVRVETLCVHGDNPRAPEFLLAVRGALKEAGIEIRPMRAAQAL